MFDVDHFMKKNFLNFTIEARDFLSSISINQASINSFILLFCMPLIDINIVEPIRNIRNVFWSYIKRVYPDTSLLIL